ncbi:PREDICTED: putative RNA-binding protein 15 [Amphimedon queenslandica]|uniref:SPOC domain-containing protein n=1 Tax=Amphimedon queenslandica TaxID=400682 RepID=A0AAN0IN67_AMPQE|nr:PREDICTED: putative RNA-binding protein 15 [Amphimedon queenslandica]|eukprot:XP_011405001.1 PREDICTED: putative RNA-binding protein 15 [Amphimedon queenslandica]
MAMAGADTALKLSDATEPVSRSPDSDGKDLDPKSDPTLSELVKSYPFAWRGNLVLVLKKTGFPARLHLVGGESSVAEYLLKSRGKDEGKDEPCVLKITQRLQLVPSGFDEVNERLTKAGSNGHCILLALPGPTDEGDNSMQLRPLRSLVSYLSQKQAAGIVTLSSSDIGDGGSENGGGVNKEEVIGVLHAFPPCEFSQARLMKAIPNLSLEPSKEDHIVILLVKGNV